MKTARLILGLSSIGTAAGLLAWRCPAARPPAPGLLPTRSVSTTAPATAPAIPVPAAASPANAVDHSLLRERECLALAEHDPLAAMDMALAENLCATDPGLLTSLLVQWAARDFAAAHDWIRQQEAGGWRDDLLARLAYLRAQTDPLAAARIVVSDIAPGPRRDEAVISPLHQWALRDPESAAAWAGAMPDGPLRERALAEIRGLRTTPG